MNPWDILGWIFVATVLISAPFTLVVLVSLAIDTVRELVRATRWKRQQKNR